MLIKLTIFRILSAFRDKMQKMRPLPLFHHFRELQLEIIKNYRPSDSEEDSPYPTFPEFIQHVIDSTKDLKTAKEWNSNVRKDKIINIYQYQ